MSVSYTEINEILSRWAANDPPIEDFTVENVLSTLNISNDRYEDVLRFLMNKEGFELVPLKMLLCPENHKGKTFHLNDPINEEEIYDCWCGEEDYYNPDNVVLVFNFTDDFKSDALKKKMNIRRPMKVG
ncbi:hypothetical protein [Pontibacillus salipaludis]|uniref:Uncharacterized protein n=1 Tax=Pontibacillus salipaludis TaxID=1697394 RepID=A0ABQ1Q4Z8_9BACI|nr:hypothetical protein [Pontibacillus salipaludis]GGD12799.1 hypothetical protein GCM10011389_20450 [Pontibacillus salipaludis]